MGRARGPSYVRRGSGCCCTSSGFTKKYALNTMTITRTIRKHSIANNAMEGCSITPPAPLTSQFSERHKHAWSLESECGRGYSLDLLGKTHQWKYRAAETTAPTSGAAVRQRNRTRDQCLRQVVGYRRTVRQQRAIRP